MILTLACGPAFNLPMIVFSTYFFAKKGIDLGQSSIDEGPMFATNINLSNSVTVKPLPAITNLPLGAPVIPNVHAAPTAPSYTG